MTGPRPMWEVDTSGQDGTHSDTIVSRLGSRQRPDAEVSASALRQRKYRENAENAEKDRIRSRVNYALRKGRLVKQPCFCGDPEVEAHHYAGYDLEHALDVAWLCKQHHEKLHKHRAGGRPRKIRSAEEAA